MRGLIGRLILLIALIGLRMWHAQTVLADAPGAYIQIVIHHRLAGLVTLAAAFAIDGLIHVIMWKGYVRRVLRTDAPGLLTHTVSFLIYAAAFIGYLQIEFDVSPTGAIAASGALAIVLGLALRSVILDLFTGLAISFDRSYDIGDWLTVTSRDFTGPIYGQVEELNWRTTRLRREDSTMFVMPNSMFGANAFTNHSRPKGVKRLAVSILLAHQVPADRAHRILLGAAYKCVRLPGFAHKPEPSVIITGFHTQGVAYEVRFFCNPQIVMPAPAHSLVAQAIHEAVLRNRFAFPGEKLEISRREAIHAGEATDAIDPHTALAQCPLFARSLDTNALMELATDAQIRSVVSGTHLMTENDPGQSLYILLDGAAVVRTQNDDGREIDVATITTGDVVGEMSLLTGAPRSASVVALTNLRALEIDKQQLGPILEARPDILAEFSEMLAARQMELEELTHRKSDTGASPAETTATRLLSQMRHFFDT